MPVSRTRAYKASRRPNPAASPAGKRLKRMWASVRMEEDCVLGNATSARSRGEGWVGTTLHRFTSLPFLCC